MRSNLQSTTSTERSLTQAERTAASDRAMLAAAIDLILEKGIEKTTLVAIGEKAGYSRGLATYRFGSKAALFDAVCKSISRRWLDYLREGVGDRIGIEAMSAAMDAFFTFISDSPKEAQVLQILYGGVAEWVRAGQTQGSIREDIDPKSVAAQYIAYISGMTYLWVLNPESIDFRKANDDMMTHLKLSLATAKRHE
ncbi:MAG: TetR/AcrR family transcriptional regulator [Woeseiales bacterium]